MPKRVLLVGATGVFGSNLAAMLCRIDGVELVLAARGAAALARLKERLNAAHPAATLGVQVFDRQHPAALAALNPWLVIDAAGPFQHSDYGLALAAVRAGAHYIDLADGRAFVAGFPQAVSPEASAAQVLAVTGASSTPALSQAALETIVEGWRGLDTVSVVIEPGGQAPKGLSVVQAILSYVGQRVSVFRGGRWTEAHGWSGLRRVYLPGLGDRWASICETPDLDLLPRRFAVQRDALFFAGLDPGLMHLGLTALSLPVRWKIIPSLAPLARPLRAAAGLLTRFSSDLGGMVVEVGGEDATGEPVQARWSLRARANSGPHIPAAAAAALARRLVEGRETGRGARACVGLLSLPDILRELEGLPIDTRVDEGHPSSPILFRRLLGARFDALPASVKVVHGSNGPAHYTGRAVARLGRSPIARVMGLVLGLPKSGRSDVEVRLRPDPRGETWTRRFGPTRFSSRLQSTDQLGIFEEQFGSLHFKFDLQPTHTGVIWTLVGWGVLGVPLPNYLGPRVHARADDRDGGYRFSVAVLHPWFGLLFAYRGQLGVGLVDRAQ